MSPRSLPFATHASTWLKTCPASGVHSSGALSRPEVPGSSPPSTKDWRALPPQGHCLRCLLSSSSQALLWGWALAAHSALVLDHVPCVGCLPVSALSHLAVSLQAFPENPSQVNTLPLNPGLWDCFTENSSLDTNGQIFLCKNRFFFLH